MTKRNQKGKAPDLAPELLQKIASTLKPVVPDQVIYRGNERQPLIAFNAPARGRFTAHAIRLTGELARHWNQESRHPQALRANNSDVPGFILFEPVTIYDSTQSDQFEISWSNGFKQAAINLRRLFQSRNLETPEGFVSEMPVSLLPLPTGRYYLFLHTGDATIRPEGDLTSEEEQEFTAEGDAETTPADKAI